MSSEDYRGKNKQTKSTMSPVVNNCFRANFMLDINSQSQNCSVVEVKIVIVKFNNDKIQQ